MDLRRTGPNSGPLKRAPALILQMGSVARYVRMASGSDVLMGHGRVETIFELLRDFSAPQAADGLLRSCPFFRTSNALPRRRIRASCVSISCFAKRNPKYKGEGHFRQFLRRCRVCRMPPLHDVATTPEEDGDFAAWASHRKAKKRGEKKKETDAGKKMLRTRLKGAVRP